MQLAEVGDPRVGGEVRLQPHHALERSRRGGVAAELDLAVDDRGVGRDQVGLEPVGALAEREALARSRGGRAPGSPAPVVASGSRGATSEGRVVGALGALVEGRVAGLAGALVVGVAEQRRGDRVGGVGADRVLEAGDLGLRAGGVAGIEAGRRDAPVIEPRRCG